MSDLRPTGIPIELGGEERNLLFTLNVMDELQSQYDESIGEIMDKLVDKREAVTSLRKIVMVLLNDDIQRKGGKEEITEQEVGWMIHVGNVLKVTEAVLKAYSYSLPEADEYDSPNQRTER